MIDVEEQYKKLYTIDGTNHWVVLDELEGVLLLRKESTTFSISAYSYLKNNRNPHLAAVVDYYEKDDKLVIFEELIQGRMLRQVIEEGKIPFNEARRIFLEICEGIRFIHEAETPIAHCCINESNIMLTNSGVVKIVDFDDSKITEYDSTLIQKDIEALGKIGKKLFNNKYKKVFDKALSDNPKNQYRSVDDLIRDVDRLIVKSKSLLPPPGFRTGKKFNMIIAIAFYVLMVLNIINDNREDTFFHYSGFNVVSWCIVYFFVIDICTDWTGMTTRLPGASHKNIAVKIVAKIVYSAVIVFSVDYFLKVFDIMIWNLFGH